MCRLIRLKLGVVVSMNLCPRVRWYTVYRPHKAHVGYNLPPSVTVSCLSCNLTDFWATVCKTVCPMLSDRCPVCLSCPVCNVGALWPNGWMDQDETWRAGRPRPWPYCVRWGPSSPSVKGAQPHPIFGPYLLRPNGCMDQDATWYGAMPEHR